jgi:hypothetical protein
MFKALIRVWVAQQTPFRMLNSRLVAVMFEKGAGIRKV